jgi:MraZ protein
MAMLTGEYNHQMDDKNRIRIPARLKKELGDEYYFAKGTNGCISVFPKATVDAQFEKLKEIKLSDLDQQRSLRSFAKSYVLGEEDNQGRTVLNPELRRYAGISKEEPEIVICGAVTRVEIWAKKVYDEYFKDEDKNFDTLFAQLDI